MSAFYARITKSARKTQPSARGHRGVAVWAQSWEGSVRVSMTSYNGKAAYCVTLHEGSGGNFKKVIASGYADGTPLEGGEAEAAPMY